MEVALYARVSTQDKDQNPEVQLSQLRDYCQRTGWGVFQEYVDAVSAADLAGRTAWTRLMKDASLHQFDAVLVWKIDRAFRSVIHATSTLSILKNYGVGFRSLIEAAIDTTTPHGEFVFNILTAVAQLERDDIRRRVNAGMAYARDHGTRSGKPIGRKRYAIGLAIVCKALRECQGNYSEAARALSRQSGRRVSPGFVCSRITRAGLTKEGVLEGRDHEAG